MVFFKGLVEVLLNKILFSYSLVIISSLNIGSVLFAKDKCEILLQSSAEEKDSEFSLNDKYGEKYRQQFVQLDKLKVELVRSIVASKSFDQIKTQSLLFWEKSSIQRKEDEEITAGSQKKIDRISAYYSELKSIDVRNSDAILDLNQKYKTIFAPALRVLAGGFNEKDHLGEKILKAFNNYQNLQTTIYKSNRGLFLKKWSGVSRWKISPSALENLRDFLEDAYLRAIEHFDVRIGFRFSTMAFNYLDSEVRNRRRQLTAVKGLRSSTSLRMEAFEYSRNVFQNTGIRPTPQEVAAHLKISEAQLMESYNQPKVARTGQTPLRWEEATPHYLNSENIAGRKPSFKLDGLSDEVQSLLFENLNQQQTFVIFLRFLSDPPMTLEEIGDLEGLGVTKERVRQIEKKALEKIRKNLEAKGFELEDFFNR